MKRFFSNDPLVLGLRFHATEEKAREEAEEALERYRKEASKEGWDEDVAAVCWGEVKQIAMESQVPAEEGATFEGEPVTHWTHYELQENGPETCDCGFDDACRFTP